MDSSASKRKGATGTLVPLHGASGSGVLATSPTRYRLNNAGNYEFDYSYRNPALHGSIENQQSRAIPRYVQNQSQSLAPTNEIVSTYGSSSSYAPNNFDRNFKPSNLSVGGARERDAVNQLENLRSSTYYNASSLTTASLAWNNDSNATYLASPPQPSSIIDQSYSIAPQSLGWQESYNVSASQKEDNLITGPSPEITEELSSNFRIHHSSQFKFGQVFKILWSEPTGVNGTQITENANSYSTKLGSEFTHKIRRFVVVKRFAGHCLALPILTYGKRATTKFSCHSGDHAIIYTENPVTYDGESLAKKPIRVNKISPRDKLAPQSRLNYSKVYTVEYNVKVHFIGEIHKDYLHQFLADYNNTQGYFTEQPAVSR